MPAFKTTENILNTPWNDELYSWISYNGEKHNTPFTPPTKSWTYDREMYIEDVDIWEILYEGSGGFGVYAAWEPYAEFYMLTLGFKINREWRPDRADEKNIELFYGPGAAEMAYRRAREFDIPLLKTTTWVDDKDMWLHQTTL